MISCFETVTQHISGQPLCNMSMEALEMMVTHAKSFLFCRPAKSGEEIYQPSLRHIDTDLVLKFIDQSPVVLPRKAKRSDLRMLIGLFQRAPIIHIFIYTYICIYIYIYSYIHICVIR